MSLTLDPLHPFLSDANVSNSGTADTITFKCFANVTDRLVATTSLPMHDLTPGASGPNAFAESFANAVAFSQRCASFNVDPTLKKRAEVLGTGMVARDLMAVVDSLHAHEGEDGLLHYWGISYGSLLGETVAALFPDRMERVVLDGIVNAEHYYHHFGLDIDQLLSSDTAFRSVLFDCITVGTSRCALADINSTAAELETTLLQMVDRYQTNPVAAAGRVINGKFVKELLIIIIKYPTGVVPIATKYIRSLLEGKDLNQVVAFYQGMYESVSMGDNDALSGIACLDKVVKATSVKDEQLLEDTEYIRNTTKIFGGFLAGITTQCAEWPFEGKGKYEEHWFDEQGNPKVIKTRKPVLFVGNRYDPVTPVKSAVTMSKIFEGSRVLERDAFGHGSVAQSSDCTTQVLRGYFGSQMVLPEDQKVCEVDVGVFDLGPFP
ncbi:TAP-like protein-domain-containing protein [Apiosordaria backusii]|uniref:TAP-like protein-domain-containing protein n=1 Tax=Apiosordaria backusii TaxID=314023 RepID=A0AA40K3P6_9PEZI|nr:TAP-like protein-domain-containing protein [Apiosordaria backusii]